jgi:hypothetical protein
MRNLVSGLKGWNLNNSNRMTMTGQNAKNYATVFLAACQRKVMTVYEFPHNFI